MNTKLYIYPVTVKIGGGGLVVMNTIATCEEDAVENALAHANSSHGFSHRTSPCTHVATGAPFEASPYHRVLSTHGAS